MPGRASLCTAEAPAKTGLPGGVSRGSRHGADPGRRPRRKEQKEKGGKEKHKGKVSHENILFSLRTGYTCRAPSPVASPRPDGATFLDQQGPLPASRRATAPEPGAREQVTSGGRRPGAATGRPGPGPGREGGPRLRGRRLGGRSGSQRPRGVLALCHPEPRGARLRGAAREGPQRSLGWTSQIWETGARKGRNEWPGATR